MVFTLLVPLLKITLNSSPTERVPYIQMAAEHLCSHWARCTRARLLRRFTEGCFQAILRSMAYPMGAHKVFPLPLLCLFINMGSPLSCHSMWPSLQSLTFQISSNITASMVCCRLFFFYLSLGFSAPHMLFKT